MIQHTSSSSSSPPPSSLSLFLSSDDDDTDDVDTDNIFPAPPSVVFAPSTTQHGVLRKHTTTTPPRPRNARENPEFLRIAVLEMALRRARKVWVLSDDGGGGADGDGGGVSDGAPQTQRRAYWLPPRRDVILQNNTSLAHDTSSRRNHDYSRDAKEEMDDTEEEEEDHHEAQREMQRAWEDEVFGRRVRIVEGRAVVSCRSSSTGRDGGLGSVVQWREVEMERRARRRRRVPRRWRGVCV